MSNLEECIDAAFRLALKLALAWDYADYSDRHLLQFLVFPEGIYYDRKTDGCRTEKVNMAFGYIALAATVLEENNKGNCGDKPQFPSLVVPPGKMSNFYLAKLVRIAEFYKRNRDLFTNN